MQGTVHANINKYSEIVRDNFVAGCFVRAYSMGLRLMSSMIFILTCDIFLSPTNYNQNLYYNSLLDLQNMVAF